MLSRTSPRKVLILAGEWTGRDGWLLADYGPDYGTLRYAVRVDGWSRCVPAVCFLD